MAFALESKNKSATATQSALVEPRKIKRRWLVVASLSTLYQFGLIYEVYSHGLSLSFLDVFPWIVSFPEFMMVILYALKIPLANPLLWKRFLPIYAVYLASFSWVIIYTYIKIFSDGPISYTSTMFFEFAVKAPVAYAVFQYWKDDTIWRWR